MVIAKGSKLTPKIGKRKMVIFSVILIAIISLLYFVCCVTPSFGRAPRGNIMERIEASLNYHDGKFHNYSPRLPSPKFTLKGAWDFATGKGVDNLRPSMSLPSIKTDLFQLDRKDNVIVWMGHSSLFVQIDSIRFLVDPILVTGSPVSFFNKPYPGTEVYKPEDIPDIDYLLITHDHWDHLDYKAVTSLKDRIGKVVCGLGVGEHFRYWKFNNENIIELDWNENVTLKENIVLHILTAQHYSGRASFGSDNTLWVSFMIEAPSANIFISGDTGYGGHFSEIGKQFHNIDLAILEFGQYGYDWRDIHIMPDEFARIINDLNPKRSFAIHNAKYTLARHSWKEPLEIASKLNEQEGFNIITPMIGELVYYKDFSQKFTKWWENIE